MTTVETMQSLAALRADALAALARLEAVLPVAPPPVHLYQFGGENGAHPIYLSDDVLSFADPQLRSVFYDFSHKPTEDQDNRSPISIIDHSESRALRDVDIVFRTLRRATGGGAAAGRGMRAAAGGAAAEGAAAGVAAARMAREQMACQQSASETARANTHVRSPAEID